MATSNLDRFEGSVIAPIGKQPVDCATLEPIELTGYQTIDGIACTQDYMRVLVKNQEDTTTNGIYVVVQGAWYRAKDFNGPSGNVSGQMVTVTRGTQAGFWQLTSPNPIQIDKSGGETTEPSAITFDAFFSNFAASETNVGFTDFVIPPLLAPNPFPSNLNLVLPAGQAVVRSVPITIPAYTATLLPNFTYDLYINPAGSPTPWTVEAISIGTYPYQVRHPTLLKVWSIQTDDTKIAAITMCAMIKPVLKVIDDISKAPDDLATYYVINGNPTAFVGGASINYGDIIVNSLGYMYQCFTLVGGTLGVSEPTGGLDGNQFTNGNVQLGYYGQAGYGGNSRYSLNGSVQSYFSNIMMKLVCGLQGITTGNQINDIVKNYIISQFKVLVTNRQNSTAYTFQQKVIAGGYIWECRNYGTGPFTTAGSSPFSGSYTPGVSVVTDGGVTWNCIFTAYGTQQYYWMRGADTTMIYWKPGDAHDSDASTFFDLIWEYVQITWDFQWMLENSPIAGFTYLQLLQNIYDKTLHPLPNNLTQSYQEEINPLNGTPFTFQYTEDAIEGYSGYIGAKNVFLVLGDATRSADAATNEVNIDGGIFGLIDSVQGLIRWYDGDDLSWVGQIQLQWYPWYQAQLFLELHNVPAANDTLRADIRRYVMQHWNNYIDDPGLTASLSNVVYGYMAVKCWQDIDAAQRNVKLTEQVFLTNGLLSSDFGYYLRTKYLLCQTHRIRNINGIKVTFEDAQGSMYTLNNRRTWTRSGDIQMFKGDYFLGVNKGTGAATAVALPNRTCLQDGYPVIIKDLKGDAATHNITVSPDGGNIDAGGSLVINAAYGSAVLRYDKATNQWYTDSNATVALPATLSNLVTLGSVAFDYMSGTAVKIGTTPNNGMNFVPLKLIMTCQANASVVVGSPVIGFGITGPNYADLLFTFVQTNFDAAGQFIVYDISSAGYTTPPNYIPANTDVYAKMNTPYTSGTMTGKVQIMGVLIPA